MIRHHPVISAIVVTFLAFVLIAGADALLGGNVNWLVVGLVSFAAGVGLYLSLVKVPPR